MKNYTKEELLKLLRKTAFHNCTFTCLNKAYQDFIFKVSEVIDLFCPSKKLQFKANWKLWTDSETVSVIRRKDKLFKKYKKLGLDKDKEHFRLAKMTQKAISKRERKLFSRKR